jgi:CDP-glucose 4,6-dehydratase
MAKRPAKTTAAARPAVKSAGFWRDRRVLVTGATGLLGSWLVRRLVAERADVVALVRDWVPQSILLSSDVLANVTVVRGDVRDQELLERTLGEYEIDTVFHLAAQTIVGVANRNPVSTLDVNIRGTWALLEAARRSPLVRSIVTASSDKAYGDHEKLPYDETAALKGEHPYDASKSCADIVARMYALTFGVPVAITRCGNFYGGGDLNWSRLVPSTIRSIIRGERPVIRSDGQYVRDYFYVEDGAAAYVLLAEQLAAHPELRGEAFNFSYDAKLTVLDLVDRIVNLMGSTLTPVVQNIATGEIPVQRLNPSKARERLGWRPTYTLDEGLGRTIGWYQQFLGGSTGEGSNGAQAGDAAS